MMLGQPTKLASQFRLTYNMILNLLRVEALKIEEMIKRSFSENVAQKMLPEHEKVYHEVSGKTLLLLCGFLVLLTIYVADKRQRKHYQL